MMSSDEDTDYNQMIIRVKREGEYLLDGQSCPSFNVFLILFVLEDERLNY